jgi:4-amino-4-deoxy-L-arabinose transferase-like glycosyltransferase
MLTDARTRVPVGAAHAMRRSGGRSTAVELSVLAGLTALAAVLRFATIAHQSFWFDEAQAAHEMQRSFGGMLALWSSNEPNPPLFFVIAWPWAKLFGTGEAGLRSLSAVAGVLTVPITWLAGRELISSRAGLVGAALATFSPFMIWYSQEAREYMLLTMLCAASIWRFARVLRAPSSRNLGWWAVVAALALATQYFAAFLICAEAGWLLYALRRRSVAVAIGVLVIVEAALLPHAIQHAAHPAHWIGSVGPLSVRVQQLPVAFGFNTLYKGGGAILSYGLIGAAVLAAVVSMLLIVGADTRELRGAGIAAGLGACVILIPLALALVGRDYVEARALLPAWIPLALLIGAACTARRTPWAGAALAAVMLAAFVWATARIDGHVGYQRQNWRGVASALGSFSGTRAIVADGGTYASAPLALYLPGVAWTGSAQAPQAGRQAVTVSEVDVVGQDGQQPSRPLPQGTSLFSIRAVDGTYLVVRFRLARPWHLAPAAIAARAQALVGPAPPSPAVLIQHS